MKRSPLTRILLGFGAPAAPATATATFMRRHGKGNRYFGAGEEQARVAFQLLHASPDIVGVQTAATSDRYRTDIGQISRKVFSRKIPRWICVTKIKTRFTNAGALFPFSPETITAWSFI